MNAITKVPFYGNEIIVIEKNGRKYVGMKPIVEALGIAWRDQQKIIKNDPILSSVRCVTHLTGNDGKSYEMVSLPLEYINGWLFKIPASRYAGKKREAIIRYQKECYNVLYNHFHNGGSVNPNANKDQLADLLKTVAFTAASAVSESMGNKILEISQQVKNFENVIIELHKENTILREFCPKGSPGEISKVTGLPKDRFVRAYFTSNKSAIPVVKLCLQLELPLEDAHA